MKGAETAPLTSHPICPPHSPAEHTAGLSPPDLALPLGPCPDPAPLHAGLQFPPICAGAALRAHRGGLSKTLGALETSRQACACLHTLPGTACLGNSSVSPAQSVSFWWRHRRKQNKVPVTTENFPLSNLGALAHSLSSAQRHPRLGQAVQGRVARGASIPSCHPTPSPLPNPSSLPRRDAWVFPPDGSLCTFLLSSHTHELPELQHVLGWGGRALPHGRVDGPGALGHTVEHNGEKMLDSTYTDNPPARFLQTMPSGGHRNKNQMSQSHSGSRRNSPRMSSQPPRPPTGKSSPKKVGREKPGGDRGSVRPPQALFRHLTLPPRSVRFRKTKPVATAEGGGGSEPSREFPGSAATGPCGSDHLPLPTIPLLSPLKSFRTTK